MPRQTLPLIVVALYAGLAACGTRAAQSDRARADLYACEGCEGLAERDPATLANRAQMSPPGEPGETLVVTGVVRSAGDGRPASGVVIYAYQTDAAGLYSRGTSESQWSRRHGLLRGWVKTGSDGRYTFRTIKPGPYPDASLPAHIHFTIGEPGKRAYYIDDVVFSGEFGVSPDYVARQELRGGSGIVRLRRDAQGVLIADRDIRLERHPAQ